MKLHKKGIFFTAVSIILFSALMFFYISSNQYNEEDSVKVLESRVLSMNSLIGDIEHDIVRGMDITSTRAFIGMAEYMTENGSFFDDFDSSFNEIILNGTIDGTVINISEDSNLGDWIDKIIDIGDKLDVDIEFYDIVVSSYQIDPWNVGVRLNGVMNLTDKKGIASWERHLNLTSKINIIGFEDPLYTVSSGGDLVNKITKSNITDFVSGTDASNLILHANNSWYIESDTAPSYLMRFSGNTSASVYGIESIIYIPDLILAGEGYAGEASSIDYIHFGNSSVSSCKVNETKNTIGWFRLDDDHLDIYEVHCEI